MKEPPYNGGTMNETKNGMLMRPVNLRSVVMANSHLPQDLRDSLFAVWGIAPKADELQSLTCFVNQLFAIDKLDPQRVTCKLDDCYFGFIIPRISKEFDCLWIGENTIVNVELKSKDVGAERIKKQLVQNRYYLRHLNMTVASFTYDSSTGNCYSLDSNEDLINVAFDDVAKAIYLVHDENLFTDDIETKFPPERFLVSPFNSTDDFLKECYFLTDQQIEIKKKVLAFANATSGGNFYAIYGGPGTGKTLLMYDIARTLMAEGKKIIIGHAGSLNNGHHTLNNNGWDIRPTKNMINATPKFASDGKTLFEYTLIDVADVFFIDEAQRCYNLEHIAKDIEKQGKKCVFSIDADQVMRTQERKYDNDNKVRAMAGQNVSTLSANIRTNKHVFKFTKALFDKRKTVQGGMSDYVEVTFCKTLAEVRTMEELLKNKGYVQPIFTPKTIGREEYEDWFSLNGVSAHAVIGQEFDKVVCLISPNLLYDGAGKLTSGKPYYYSEERMVYQILSRARSKIHLIIYDNPMMLERCLKLIK